jgi:hypothetical protein
MTRIQEILGDYAPTDELKVLVHELQQSVNSAQTVAEVERVLETLNEEGNLLYKKQQEIRRLNPASLAQEEAFRATDLKATTLLKRRITEAARSTSEYNSNFFISRLREAASEGCLSYTITGNTLQAIIDLDITAGTLEDYFSGVEEWRKEHYDGRIPPPIKLASKMWEEKIYRVDRENGSVPRWNKDHTEEHDVTENFVGKYWQTMESRLELSGKLAPFWRLLNDGNINLGESGYGHGGDAYPAQGPTNFVEKAEQDIVQEYERLYGVWLSKIRAQLDRFLTVYDTQLSKLRTVISKCENLRAQLVRDVEIQSRTDQKKKAEIINSPGQRNIILNQRLTLREKLEAEAAEARAELARLRAERDRIIRPVAVEEKDRTIDSILSARKAALVENIMAHLNDIEKSKVDEQRIQEVAEQLAQGDISNIKSRTRISLGGGIRKSFGNILEEL